MTTVTPTDEWVRSLKAEEVASDRLTQIDDTERITAADEENVRKWARIFVNATEKLGSHAMDEAKARAAAQAHVRMRLKVDEEDGPIEDASGAAERAFKSALDLYLRMLAGELPRPSQTGRWVCIEIGMPGSPISVETYCPKCAIDQREDEERRGHRWPMPWEHSAVTGSVRIKEVRRPDFRGTCWNCGVEA